MIPSTPYDELEFERLYKRLLHQNDSAFFCVTLNAKFSHIEIADKIRERFPVGTVQIIDFAKTGSGFRFSSEFLRDFIEADTKIVFLPNFHLARGDMPEAEFFQILNLSRDALAQLPVVLVFMMPMYFRIEIARKTPDFNSFFAYRADFAAETTEPLEIASSPMGHYSESKSDLLSHYKNKYDTLTDHNSKDAFEAILQILTLNADVRTLSFVELDRFYGAFERLLPSYQNDFDGSPDDVAYVYRSQGDYDKALLWYEKALEISEKVLGKNHPSTATIYNNIALIYRNQGD